MTARRRASALAASFLSLSSIVLGAEAEWVLERIQPADRAGRYTSIALDASGQPHVSYYDHGAGDLKYAWRGHAGWTIETVDAAGDVGRYTSLALDAEGWAHISYFDDTRGDLKYARRHPGGWSLEVVDASGHVGDNYTSLALDASGRPAISYYDSDNEDLKFARKEDGSWTIRTVDAFGRVGQYSALALDASGRAHISYFDLVFADLKYAREDGASWVIQVVDSIGFVGVYTSLALDGDGLARIAYTDFSNLDLKYARQTGPFSWELETVDFEGNVGEFNAIALDPAGRPRVLYFDDSRERLKYAERDDSGGWLVEVVDPGPESGNHGDLALDAVGVSHISYFQSGGFSDLKYAARRPVPAGALDGGTGGELVFDADGTRPAVRLAAPPGAFAGPARVTVRPAGPLPEGGGCAASLLGTEFAADVRVEGLLLPGRRVQLGIAYLDAPGLDASRLLVARYDDAIGCWLPLPSRVDAAARVVWVGTDRFSLFRLMGAAAFPPGGVAVYPNPLRPSSGRTEMRFMGLPAGARVRLHGLAGDHVRDLLADGAGMAVWDGRNEAGRPVASGVYAARVENGGDGRTIKIMVER